MSEAPGRDQPKTGDMAMTQKYIRYNRSLINNRLARYDDRD